MTTTTRYYFDTAAPTAAPAYAAQWAAIDAASRRTLSTAKPSVSYGGTAAENVNGLNHALLAQYVGPATLQAGPLSGSMRAVAVAASSWGLAAPLYLSVVVRVVSADGTTVRGVLAATTGATAFGNSGNIQSRTVAAPLTPVTAQDGDRLIVEVGAYGGWSDAGLADFTLSGGGASQPDLTFDETQNNNNLHPWFELILNDPPAPPAAPVDLTQTAAAPVSVDVAWTAPATGEPASSYEYRLDGGTITDVGLSTALTLGGLAPATSYLLEVRTVAATGVSAWSPLVVATAAADGLGELRLEVGPAGAAVDLLGDAYSIRVNRGPSRGPVVDRLEVGTLLAVIDGPAANPVTTPQVRPGADVRVLVYAVTAEGLAWTPVYTGTLDRARVEFDGGADKADPDAYRVTLTARDVVAAAADTPPGPAVSGNLAQRVDSVLAPTGLPYTVTDTDAPRGTAPLASGARTALEALELARTTAHAIAYVDRHNTIQVVADSARPRAELVPDFTATDVPAADGLHYWSLVPVYDTSAITNVLELTRLTLDADDTVATYTDPDSLAEWGPRSDAVTVNDGVLETHADLWLATRATPDLVPEQLGLNVGARPEHLPAAVALEPYAVLRVTRTGVLPPVDVSVRTITHAITADRTRGVRWLLTLDLAPLEVLATRWRDVPPAVRWADVPPGLTWRQAVRWRPWLT